MSESRETLLKMIQNLQALNEQNHELFAECDWTYRIMQPEL